MTLPTRQDKPAYVSRVFGSIARHYDLMNRLMTAGMDRAWRKAAVQWLDPQPGHVVLDLGTGTGDFLPLLAARGCRVVGADFSLPMMLAGRPKLVGARTSLVAGDAMQLPFPDASFDGLLNGFLLRNVADLDGALAEMRRVLKPGGKVVCLEITWPHLPLFREAFGIYFGHLVPLVGRMVSGDPEAYSYLPQSVAAFVTASELADRMRIVGFADVAHRRLALGAVALHRGVR